MIVVIATNKIIPNHRDKALNVIRTYMEGCRELPGVISANLTEKVDDPNTFIIIEEFEDKEALNHHGKSQVFHDLMEALGSILASVPFAYSYTVSQKNQLM